MQEGSFKYSEAGIFVATLFIKKAEEDLFSIRIIVQTRRIYLELFMSFKLMLISVLERTNDTIGRCVVQTVSRI